MSLFRRYHWLAIGAEWPIGGADRNAADYRSRKKRKSVSFYYWWSNLHARSFYAFASRKRDYCLCDALYFCHHYLRNIGHAFYDELCFIEAAERASWTILGFVFHCLWYFQCSGSFLRLGHCL